MIEEAVRYYLQTEIMGGRQFEVKAAPFRRWQLRIFKTRGDGDSARPFIDVELDASQINLRPKAFTRRILSPALDLLRGHQEAA